MVVFVALSSVAFADETILTEKKYEKGDQSKEIRLIQLALEKDGVFQGDEVTDYFGNKTLKSVKEFQKKYGLTCDGIVGKGTIKKMDELSLFPKLNETLYRKGDEGNDIILIQRALELEGFFEGEYSETFGPKTEAAVKAFQKEYGLMEDGVIGSECIQKFGERGTIAIAKEPETFVAKTAVAAQTAQNENSNLVGNLMAGLYKKGMSHPDIKVLQEALRREECFNEEENTYYFGNKTEAAVKMFQEKYEIDADGIAGNDTLVKLEELELVSRELVVASRSANGRKAGEYLKWWGTVNKMITRKETIMVVEDYETGITFSVLVSGGTNHADVEALTAKDSEIMKQVWGKWSWTRRPVLVYMNGRAIAASMTAMPHAGREDKKYGVTVSNRTAGFGRGYNYDYLKGNGMSGHVDIHFRGSQRHSDGRQDSQHQAAIKISAGK